MSARNRPGCYVHWKVLIPSEFCPMSHCPGKKVQSTSFSWFLRRSMDKLKLAVWIHPPRCPIRPKSGTAGWDTLLFYLIDLTPAVPLSHAIQKYKPGTASVSVLSHVPVSQENIRGRTVRINGCMVTKGHTPYRACLCLFCQRSGPSILNGRSTQYAICCTTNQRFCS